MASKHKTFRAHAKHMGTNILKMNDETYAMRRVVIDSLYKVNRLLQSNGLGRLPRQEVRIAGRTWVCGGMASTGNNIVTIPLQTIKRGAEHTYRIVLHEVVHSAFGIGHPDTGCPLMDADTTSIDKPSLAELEQVFIGYARG